MELLFEGEKCLNRNQARNITPLENMQNVCLSIVK